MITVYASNGAVYEFPDCTKYKWGDKTIKLYDGSDQVGNFVAENMDCVVEDGVAVRKNGNTNAT